MAATLLLLALSCGGPETEQRREPPAPAAAQRGEERPLQRQPLRVVLLTCEGLRLDALTPFGGSASVAPQLESLRSQADFVGIAVAPTSYAPGSLASLWTGLQPLRHGVWGAGQELAAEHLTLAEWFGQKGFATLGWRDLIWLQEEERGFSQGFDGFRWLLNLRRIGDRLSLPLTEDQFVWVGQRRPGMPYERDVRLFDQLSAELSAAELASLPERIALRSIAPYYDPRSSLPSELRAALENLSLSNLARADRVLGAVWRQLEASDALENTLVVIAGTNGESLAEEPPGGNVWSGATLAPAEVLVPILVHLPRGAVWRSGRAVIEGGLPQPRSLVPLVDLGATLKGWVSTLKGYDPLSQPAQPTWHSLPSVIVSELWWRAGRHSVAAYEQGYYLLQSIPALSPSPPEWRQHVASERAMRVDHDAVERAAQLVQQGCPQPCSERLEAWTLIKERPPGEISSKALPAGQDEREVLARELWREWLLRNGTRDRVPGEER